MDWVNTYFLVLAFTVISRETCQLSINIGESPSCDESSKHILNDSVQCIMPCLTKNLPGEQDCSDQKNSSYNTKAVQKIDESMSTTTDGPSNYNSTSEPQTVDQNKPNEKQKPLSKTGLSSSVQVLVSTDYGISSIDISNGKVLSTLRNNSVSFTRFDYLYDEKLFFYTTITKIIRANIEGTVLKNSVAIVDEDRRVGSLAVDWVNRRLYWTEPELYCSDEPVMTSDLDGTNKRRLFDNLTLCLNSYEDLVVDPYNGAVFVLTHSFIYKSNLDGSNVSRLLEGNADVRQVFAIALDRTNRKLYFHAMGYWDYYFGRVDYDGVEAIQKFKVNLGMNFILDVFGDTVYLARRNSSLYPGCPHILSSLSTTDMDEPLLQDLYQPYPCHKMEKIKVYHPCAQSLNCEDMG